MKILKISMGLLLTANVAIAADKEDSIERPGTPTNATVSVVYETPIRSLNHQLRTPPRPSRPSRHRRLFNENNENDRNAANATVSEVYTTPVGSLNHQLTTPPRPSRHRRPFNENNENDRNAANYVGNLANRLVSSSDLALTPTNCISSTNNPRSPFKKRRAETSFLNTSMSVISNGNDSNCVNRNLFGSNVNVSVISDSSSNHRRRNLSSDIAVISDLETIISDLGTIISDSDTTYEINSDDGYNIISDSDSDSDNILNRRFIIYGAGSSGSSSDSESDK